ncbi:MAG: zinc ribbon domain-containing protein [Defluviitaleaceae bacterium]|nr:zinc ribbon domain-containing protein [Defluviitaleaceae bacterium]MCL2274656.1 zinc ribbon domain-containing protein [Defluviitaleaceae bacterium]MCL2275783.1 zinc ribbon domain-containing protein [Defluviitaleaceae bacterium]
MSDIRETLFNITKNASKTTGDLIKSAKLNMALGNEQAALKNLYTEIGKKVHEIYQYGGSLGKFFDDKYLELENTERKIAEIKEEISIIKGVRECIKCGKAVERNAEFCPKCGIRLEGNGTAVTAEAPAADVSAPVTPPAVEPPPVPVAPPAPAGVVCRVCHASNDAGTKFCLSCGRMLD